MITDRRTFLKNGAHLGVKGLTWGAVVGSVALIQRRPPTYASKSREPGVLRPPGALDENAFLAACIRCQRCRDACPVGAIRLSGVGDPAGYGTPFLMPADAACTLCLECTVSCPTGALIQLEKKETVHMGTAVVDERTCVSINGSGVCGACHTACPFRNKAITQGLRNAPTVHAEYCVGCGLCEEACIVEGTKAIRVFSGRNKA